MNFDKNTTITAAAAVAVTAVLWARSRFKKRMERAKEKGREDGQAAAEDIVRRWHEERQHHA